MSLKSSRIRLLLGVFAVGLIAAGCDTIGFFVDKQVTNGTSSGPFVVHFECTNDLGTQSGDLTFNGSGSNGIGFDTSPTGTTTCTITEPTTAGATGVSFSCTPVVAATCSNISGGLQVVADAGASPAIVNVSVTNDFTGATTTLPGTAPDAPINVTARIGSVIVSWTAPSNPGSSPITSYRITQNPGGAIFGQIATARSLELECPPPGTYTYTVQAINASGASAPSLPSNAVTVTEACGVGVRGATAVQAQPTATG